MKLFPRPWTTTISTCAGAVDEAKARASRRHVTAGPFQRKAERRADAITGFIVSLIARRIGSVSSLLSRLPHAEKRSQFLCAMLVPPSFYLTTLFEHAGSSFVGLVAVARHQSPEHFLSTIAGHAAAGFKRVTAEDQQRGREDALFRLSHNYHFRPPYGTALLRSPRDVLSAAIFEEYRALSLISR